MPSKQQIVSSIEKIARKLGRAPSRVEFHSHSGVSAYFVLQYFRTWSEAIRAARLRSPFQWLRHGPTNEQGVVFLFGMLAKELGYRVKNVQEGFPDCEALRQIAYGRWQRVSIEFEFESRNFRDHGHPETGCDVIVCWKHNWEDCPAHLEVLELSAIITSQSSLEGQP